MSTIPIGNLYYLLLYAWDVLEDRDVASVSTLQQDHPDDLLLLVLADATERLLSGQLDRQYTTKPETLSTIRGSINFAETIASGALIRRALVCDVDGLRVDSLRNRILKGTIRSALQADSLEARTKKKLLRLYGSLRGISDITITHDLFQRVRSRVPNRHYRLVMSVCELIHDCLIPDDRGRGVQFVGFHRDPAKMRRLFEAFVRNFLRRKRTDLSVRARGFQWSNISGDPASVALIPSLNTDVVVESSAQTLVIDTKFTDKWIVTGRWGTQRFVTDHLYQLFAYLSNFPVADDRPLKGMLLYPAVRESEEHSAIVAGYPITWATIDLSGNWASIEDRLLYLVAKEVESLPASEKIATASSYQK